jgi:hypothetical protein
MHAVGGFVHRAHIALVSLLCISVFLADDPLCRITTVLSDAFIPKACTTSELLFRIFMLLGVWFTLQNVVYYAMRVAL